MKQQKQTLDVVEGLVVGVTGFEPTTSWSRTKRSTKLSYTPGCLRRRRDGDAGRSKPFASGLVKQMMRVDHRGALAAAAGRLRARVDVVAVRARLGAFVCVVGVVAVFGGGGVFCGACSSGCADDDSVAVTVDAGAPVAVDERDPQCLVLSRPVRSELVTAVGRRPLLRPACAVFNRDGVIWADDRGVHVEVAGRVVDVAPNVPTVLHAESCVAGAVLGRKSALVQTVDGVVRVDAAGTTPFALPSLREGERVVSLGSDDQRVTVAIGHDRRRVVGLDGGVATAVIGREGAHVGHVDGTVVVLDDGRRFDVGFVPDDASAVEHVVVASDHDHTRGYIDDRLVFAGDCQHPVLGVTGAALFASVDDVVTRYDSDGAHEVYRPRDGVTAAGVAFAGRRELVHTVVDRLGRLLVRERIRNLDCSIRDAVTLIDDAGAHVVADGEGLRSSVAFYGGAPAWVESTMTYEPLSDASGTSDP